MEMREPRSASRYSLRITSLDHCMPRCSQLANSSLTIRSIYSVFEHWAVAVKYITPCRPRIVMSFSESSFDLMKFKSKFRMKSKASYTRAAFKMPTYDTLHYVHSSFMPTFLQRWRRHAWHLRRIHMSISHLLPYLHTYWALRVMLRRKNPVHTQFIAHTKSGMQTKTFYLW